MEDRIALEAVHRYIPWLAGSSTVNAVALGAYAVAGGLPSALLLWVAGIAATSALGLLAYRRRSLVDPPNPRRVRRLLSVRCVVAGVLYGGMSGHVIFLGGPAEQTVALLVVAGTAAGAALAYIRSREAAGALIAPMMLLTWIGYAAASPTDALYLAPIFAAYLVFLYGATGLGARMFRDYVDGLDQLSARTRRLTALENERAALMTTLSHEMRTPLHQILGFSDVLLKSAQDAGRRTDADHARFVFTAADALQRNIGRALELRRLSAVSAALEIGRVDLAALTQDAALEAEAKAALRDQIVTTDAPASGVTLETDGAALRTMLICLIENAAQTSGQGATIHVAAHGGVDGPGVLVWRDGADAPEATLAGDAELSGTADAREIGVRLFLAQALAERLGGDVLVEAVPGGGVARLRLPHRAPTDAAATA